MRAVAGVRVGRGRGPGYEQKPRHRSGGAMSLSRRPDFTGARATRPPAYLTNWLSLKIGRMMLMAMNPTMPPITTIMIGSIMAVTPLMTAFSSRL